MHAGRDAAQPAYVQSRWRPSARLRRLLFAVAPPVVAAGLGTLAARDAPAQYGRLQKPSWAPPASAFGPVWSGLYVSIGVAGWHLHPRSGRIAKVLHLSQMVTNTAWPAVFFGGRRKSASVTVIAVLDGLVVSELLALRRSDPAAAVMLLPYLGWSVFATALNVAVSAPGRPLPTVSAR